jgi:hypothetical protein
VIQPSIVTRAKNTTSVTRRPRSSDAAERLSTDLTSLVEGVVTFSCRRRDACRTTARSVARHLPGNWECAKLVLVCWCGEGQAPPPPKLAAGWLADNLRRSDAAARSLKDSRHRRGALTLETIEARGLRWRYARDAAAQSRTRAAELIEDFAIAANNFTARAESRFRLAAAHCADAGSPVAHRELAAETGTTLPPTPDSRGRSKAAAY